jgi:hypothetical protein
MTLARRILVQVGALLPLILSGFVVLARRHPEFPGIQVLFASAAIALTGFLCVWIGLSGE